MKSDFQYVAARSLLISLDSTGKLLAMRGSIIFTALKTIDNKRFCSRGWRSFTSFFTILYALCSAIPFLFHCSCL